MIVCPHGQQVMAGQYQGVMHYGHPDGRGCDILNNYTLSCSDILVLLIKDYGFAAFAASFEVRMQFYHVLSTRDVAGLKTYLPTLAEWLALLPMPQDILSELDAVFGSILWENIKGWYPQPVVLKQKQLPRLPMASLKDDLNSTWLDIDRAVNKVNRRMGR